MPNREIQVKALSSELRLQLLRVLVDPGRHFSEQESADPVKVGVCVQLLAQHFSVSQPTMSRHVDILKRASFLNAERRQKWTYCSRDEAALAEYTDWLVRTLNITAS